MIDASESRLAGPLYKEKEIFHRLSIISYEDHFRLKSEINPITYSLRNDNVADFYVPRVRAQKILNPRF